MARLPPAPQRAGGGALSSHCIRPCARSGPGSPGKRYRRFGLVL